MQNFIDLFGRKPGNVLSDCKLGETLRKFRNEKAHMAIVREAPDWVEIKHGARVSDRWNHVCGCSLFTE